MKNLFILLISSLTLFNSCSLIPEPEFKSVKEIKLLPTETKGVKIEAKTVYYNPGSFDITIKQLDLDVFLKGKKIGSVNQKIEAVMPSKKETIIPINLNIKQEVLMQQMIGSILDIFSAQKKITKFVFKGTSTASVFGISTQNPVEFETEVDLDILKFAK